MKTKTHFAMKVVMTILGLSMGIDVCPTREVTVDRGTLLVTTPGWPGEYLSDGDCTLTVTTGERNVVHVKFEEFAMEPDEDDPDECKYDALILTDGKKAKKYCGEIAPEDYESTGNSITLQFKSDESFQLRGFQLKITTKVSPLLPPADAESVCPIRTIKRKRSGAFISPNYPLKYSNNALCNVTIQVPDNFMTTVWFETLSLQADPLCAKDSLVIKDESKGSTYCGYNPSKVPAPLQFYGHKVSLAFKSDSSTTAKGFYVKYNMTRLKRGNCMCFNGLEYITIKKFHRKTFLGRDEIKFRFKTRQADGLIVFSKGTHVDYVYIALQGGSLFYEQNLGTGSVKAVLAGAKLNDDKWHKVVMKRQGKAMSIDVDRGKYTVSRTTPGAFKKLDIPNSVGHVLGVPSGFDAPSGKRLVSNYVGCIKHFYIDGREPLTNALIGKRDFNLHGRPTVRLC